MLWSRYTLIGAIAAALGGSTGVGASAQWEVYAKRQEPAESDLVATTLESPTTAATIDGSMTAMTSTAAETATITTSNAATESTSETAAATPTQSVPAAQPTDSDVKACHADTESAIYPFCEPTNGQEVYVDESYYVTWDVDAFKINSTVQINLDYVNTTQNEGRSAYASDRIPNKIGFVTLQMDKIWLRDESRNNLTLYLLNYDLATEDHSIKKAGPMISLTKKPVQHYPPPPPSKPNKLGLAVGLPISLAVVFIIACGLCIGMRKHRRIGLGSIMGRRNRGYGGAKSKIERLGRGRRRDRSIRMDDLEDADRYMDNPHERADTDRFNEVERSQGNAFRTELPKLKTWR
ncbi:predicted protein [Uncinocarpus reesii 1704]|uniref:Uncharacterized protein n=1 Tax=Uncinocarpus reesii (strain UAMH 1704) TaxID=336963 RepID=C4JRR4_UNCRE|nr:uncharacterized protein UREG_05153 [Uncinocarpus reesii 1704]EEP80311.1 predicted protein [Uncinocarpus reesii 1704]